MNREAKKAFDEAAALIESLSARSAIVTPEKIEDAVRAHLGTSDRAQMLIDDIKKLFVLGGNTDGGTNEEAK